MTEAHGRTPNPDLLVGAGNKQRWNQPQNRRHGFHNLHSLYRRGQMMRARHQLVLCLEERPELAALAAVETLTSREEFSALVCLQGNRIVLSRHACDFDPGQPHSIQSITKLFMHLVSGKLIGDGLLNPDQAVEHYVPDIGSGYRGASVQDVLDMNVINTFVEDYSDTNADSFSEEMALGWRLPPEGEPDVTMRAFVTSVAGGDLLNRASTVNYCSANTDLLTLICDAVSPGRLPEMIAQIVEDIGIEGAFHISLSPEGLPAFSGGGCMSATDLARFGLLLARVASAHSATVGNSALTQAVMTRTAKTLEPPRDHVRYANQMMTNGRWVGHAGYGGQFLMVDTITGLSCAYLSVLENDSGYCDDYMAETIASLETLLAAYT